VIYGSLHLDWLLPVSLAVLSAGIIVSVYEEWAKSGLDDTSFLSLALWIMGLAGVMAWGIVDRDTWSSAVVGVPLVIFAYWFVKKWHDRHVVKRRRR
jgi:hypothetical protein